MEKPAILIVEDDDEVRTQMKWALTQEYEVFLAEDRQSALQHLTLRLVFLGHGALHSNFYWNGSYTTRTSMGIIL